MGRLSFFLVPLLVAAGFLVCAAYRHVLDAERALALMAFLVVAVPIGSWGRSSAEASERELSAPVGKREDDQPTGIFRTVFEL